MRALTLSLQRVLLGLQLIQLGPLGRGEGAGSRDSIFRLHVLYSVWLGEG